MSTPEFSFDETELRHQTVGPYRILRLLGQGGMGSVYEAEQQNPRRLVALKLLRSTTNPTTLRRFQYESQVLGHLRHPGIAHVHDAGTARIGDVEVPYIAMEYIPDAAPLNAYARSHELSIHDKLTLFIAICKAIEHGHRKGVIHRDLKPDNVLVDSTRQVKVIDFGIAKVTSEELGFTRQTDEGTDPGNAAIHVARAAPGRLTKHR